LIGYFAEFEGTVPEINLAVNLLASALGEAERRNYMEIFVAHVRERGMQNVPGAEFQSVPTTK
jgi:hypothetical protein